MSSLPSDLTAILHSMPSCPMVPDPFPPRSSSTAEVGRTGPSAAMSRRCFRCWVMPDTPWFSINYRLAPAHPFLDQVQDVSDAIQWVKLHSKEYKVDSTRIALIGESAGGHLVSWIGVTQPERTLAAVVPFYAPNDLLGRAEKSGISENVQKLLGIGPELNDKSREALRNASPYYRVQKGLPPFLLIHGTADTQVPYDQSVSMQKKLKSAGVPCDLFTVPGGAHGMGSWDKVDTSWKNYLIQWLRQNMPVVKLP